MVVGGLFLGAGYAAISLATSFTQVLVIFGVLIAPANVLLGPVAVTVLLSRWFAERRGRAIGIAIAGVAAGGFVFPMIIQGLLDAHQWREALQLLASSCVVWTVPAALLVVDRPSDRGLNPDGAAERGRPGARRTGQGADLGARRADRSRLLDDRRHRRHRDRGTEGHGHQPRPAGHRQRHRRQRRGHAHLDLCRLRLRREAQLRRAGRPAGAARADVRRARRLRRSAWRA